MKKRLKIAVITFLSLVVISIGGFLIYASDYYRADAQAIAILEKEDVVQTEDNLIILASTTQNETALIFYPGAKVEYTAYLPILEKIQQNTGVMVVVVKMPFNMAIFNADVADSIMEQFPEIKNWYIAGHSMGGAMASNYASKNQDKVQVLILLGAYIYGDYPTEKALTIYGSFNTSVAEKIDYSENIVVIEGGNHAQFGNYGKQKGDADATITSDEQQDIAVEAIKAFIER